MAWAIDVKGIGGSDRLILMLLAECHNGKTGQCNPGLDWLQERTGLKERALQTRMKALEQANLVEREYAFLGRGRGSQVVQYALKIGIMGVVKDTNLDPQENADLKLIDPQTDAPASKCARKNTSLDPHVDAVPYKEEPEKNRKYISGKSALEEIWRHWSKEGRKRSDSKSNLMDRLNRMGRTEELDDVVIACVKFAKSKEAEYHPGLQVFLKSGKWENWLSEAQAPEQPKSLDDWKQAAANYCELGVWPADLGPPPHQPGCKAPVGLLKSIAKRLEGDNRHQAIIHNIGEAA
jgi:hypothetical protein